MKCTQENKIYIDFSAKIFQTKKKFLHNFNFFRKKPVSGPERSGFSK